MSKNESSFSKLKKLRAELCKDKAGSLLLLNVKNEVISELIKVKKLLESNDSTDEIVVKIDHVISLIDENKK